mmetsp:Transcript_12221/g.31410  ORF Transcript_12221/g.31410 Transcript_12221/m.31410 type:complete len:381 (-) Transcript_12221:1590-2732(-)
MLRPPLQDPGAHRVRGQGRRRACALARLRPRGREHLLRGDAERRAEPLEAERRAAGLEGQVLLAGPGGPEEGDEHARGAGREPGALRGRPAGDRPEARLLLHALPDQVLPGQVRRPGHEPDLLRALPDPDAVVLRASPRRDHELPAGELLHPGRGGVESRQGRVPGVVPRQLLRPADRQHLQGDRHPRLAAGQGRRRLRQGGPPAAAAGVEHRGLAQDGEHAAGHRPAAGHAHRRAALPLRLSDLPAHGDQHLPAQLRPARRSERPDQPPAVGRVRPGAPAQWLGEGARGHRHGRPPAHHARAGGHRVDGRRGLAHLRHGHEALPRDRERRLQVHADQGEVHHQPGGVPGERPQGHGPGLHEDPGLGRDGGPAHPRFQSG